MMIVKVVVEIGQGLAVKAGYLLGVGCQVEGMFCWLYSIRFQSRNTKFNLEFGSPGFL